MQKRLRVNGSKNYFVDLKARELEEACENTPPYIVAFTPVHLVKERSESSVPFRRWIDSVSAQLPLFILQNKSYIISLIRNTNFPSRLSPFLIFFVQK